MKKEIKKTAIIGMVHWVCYTQARSALLWT